MVWQWFCRNGALEIIHCPHILVSTLKGRFDYVTLRFCGLLLGFMGDCTITLSAVVAVRAPLTNRLVWAA